MWMLREPRMAGMPFDEDNLQASGLLIDDFEQPQEETPVICLDGQALSRTGPARSMQAPRISNQEDISNLETRTRIHDSLAMGGGMSVLGCLAWQLMEWLPFRRMDLQPDGSWKPISWPLPRGETRDMPDDAFVHSSVIRRMQADRTYRPGNLILGGGGRGVRRAAENVGIGNWRMTHAAGDRLGEAVVRVEAEGQDITDNAG